MTQAYRAGLRARLRLGGGALRKSIGGGGRRSNSQNRRCPTCRSARAGHYVGAARGDAAGSVAAPCRRPRRRAGIAGPFDSGADAAESDSSGGGIQDAFASGGNASDSSGGIKSHLARHACVRQLADPRPSLQEWSRMRGLSWG